MKENEDKKIKEDELYDYSEIVGEGNKPLNSLSKMLKKQLNSDREKLKKVYQWE